MNDKTFFQSQNSVQRIYLLAVKKQAKIITRTIWALSLVSLFTDVASEMLYPVMPIYLKSIGFSIVLIGILEGVAEAIAGLSKGYFGKMSDNTGRRLPFVRWGYLLSAISKPMMALFTFPIWIFSARSIDRIGKGVRTGARDALLSDEATADTKGTVFGFHRSMDTLGAVAGPLIALFFLNSNPEKYTSLFYLAFIPGLVAISLTFLIKDKNPIARKSRLRTSFADFFNYWREAPPQYRQLVLPLLLFALVNSSDVFLLLRLKETGSSDQLTIGVYILYNLIYAVFAYPLGVVADRIGLKGMLMGGLALFVIVYLGMAFNTNLHLFYLLFFLYGVYAAATEGVSKAWISNLARKGETATAIGTFTGFQSICTMLASSLAGLLWSNFGASVTFTVSATTTAIVLFIIAALKEKPSN